ncbi:hypothetical protein ES288_D10G088300v1 [Gossypium darwinii]|uniref:NADH-quinone oxidoreductase subunit D domain-containing protein n=1 Tax=Gossypium darwinii TaxID=34276 RepID=A0A5D2AWY0_GOSDA|nr:hypothetical protein ES288_D10G088300v1 [Gossypium darwinii]
MIVNMGRHHPSMHGVLCLIITLEGEDVVDCEPILERELVYDLFEAVTGMRMMHNYFVSEEWRLIYLTELLNIKNLLREILFFFELVEKISVIGGEEVINWGLFGPIIQVSGIKRDFQKVDHYEFQINEMTKSIKIIQQALERISGERDPEWNDFEYRFISKKSSPTFGLSRQEMCTRMESPKGELGKFLTEDQRGFPWRWKILVNRMKLANIMTILGTIDIIMGEVDIGFYLLKCIID